MGVAHVCHRKERMEESGFTGPHGEGDLVRAGTTLRDVLYFVAVRRLDIRSQIACEGPHLAGVKTPQPPQYDNTVVFLEDILHLHAKAHLSWEREDFDRLQSTVFQVNGQFHLVAQAGLLWRSYEQTRTFTRFAPAAGQAQQSEINVAEPVIMFLPILLELLSPAA